MAKKGSVVRDIGQRAQLALCYNLTAHGRPAGPPRSVCFVPTVLTDEKTTNGVVLTGLEYPMYVTGPATLASDRLQSFMTNSYCYRKAKTHVYQSNVRGKDQIALTKCRQFEKELATNRRVLVCEVRTVEFSRKRNKKLFKVVFRNHVTLSYFLRRFTRPVEIDKASFSMVVIGPTYEPRFAIMRPCELTLGRYVALLKHPYVKHTGSIVTRIDSGSASIAWTPCLLCFDSNDLHVMQVDDRCKFSELVNTTEDMCVCFNASDREQIVHLDIRKTSYTKILVAGGGENAVSRMRTSNLFFNPSLPGERKPVVAPPRTNNPKKRRGAPGITESAVRKVQRTTFEKKSPGSYNPGSNQPRITDCFKKRRP